MDLSVLKAAISLAAKLQGEVDDLTTVESGVGEAGEARSIPESRPIPEQSGVPELQISGMALYDAIITDEALRQTTRQLYADGHYALSVEEAYKCLNNQVKAKSGSASDGAPLMTSTFSLNNPVLALSSLRTESQRNQQLGYMQILAGCMIGIRNPRAHEHRYMDEPHIALEMLAWANHLMRLVGGSRKRRQRRANQGP